MTKKQRLDRVLVDRGYYSSRSAAGAAIMAGSVAVGPGKSRARKPGQPVDASADISVLERRKYVSRGGLKLETALGRFSIDVRGRRCLDVGASTGGFTDCLLQNGAAVVTSLDVGYGLLDWSLRTDERVTVRERINARNLRCEDIDYRPDLITVDVSFISLCKVLPAVLATAGEEFEALALIKPQFEVGRRHAKGGVVRDADARVQALVDVGAEVERLGYSVRGYCFSGLLGPAGNRESFVRIDGKSAGVGDLRAAALLTESDVEGVTP